MKHAGCHDRRGSALLVVVVLLAIGVVLIAAVVEGGAREQHIAVQRLATVRALYAAEAGMNLALYEVMLDSDEDGDGTIGTISDDGDPATDPVIGGTASLVVTATPAGNTTTLESAGVSAQARRVLELDLEY